MGALDTTDTKDVSDVEVTGLKSLVTENPQTETEKSTKKFEVFENPPTTVRTNYPNDDEDNNTEEDTDNLTTGNLDIDENTLREEVDPNDYREKEEEGSGFSSPSRTEQRESDESLVSAQERNSTETTTILSISGEISSLYPSSTIPTSSLETTSKYTEDGLETTSKYTEDGLETTSKYTQDGLETTSKYTQDGLETTSKYIEDGLVTTSKYTQDGLELSLIHI